LHTRLVNAPWSLGCPVAPGWGAEVGVPRLRSGVPLGVQGRGGGWGTEQAEAAAGRAKRRVVAPGASVCT